MEDKDLSKLLEEIKKKSEAAYRHIVGLIKYMARAV